MKYIKGILSVFSVVLLFSTIYYLKEQNKKIPILVHNYDSLRIVNNNLTVELQKLKIKKWIKMIWSILY